MGSIAGCEHQFDVPSSVILDGKSNSNETWRLDKKLASGGFLGGGRAAREPQVTRRRIFRVPVSAKSMVYYIFQKVLNPNERSPRRFFVGVDLPPARGKV